MPRRKKFWICTSEDSTEDEGQASYSYKEAVERARNLNGQECETYYIFEAVAAVTMGITVTPIKAEKGKK